MPTPPKLLSLCLKMLLSNPAFVPFLILAQFYIRTFGLGNPGKAIECLNYVPDAVLDYYRDSSKQPNEIWNHGLYAISHFVYVATQWYLEKNIGRYKPRLVILVIDTNQDQTLQHKRTLQEFRRMQFATRRDPTIYFGEIHLDNCSGARAWNIRQLQTLAKYYKYFMDLHVSLSQKSGPILFIQHTNTDKWQSSNGRSPEAVGRRGPEEMPSFAYSCAILYSACLYGISIESFVEQLERWCPVSSFLVRRMGGLAKIYNEWENVLDIFAEMHRHRLYDYAAMNLRQTPRPERVLVYNSRFVSRYLAKQGVESQNADYNLHLPLHRRELIKQEKRAQRRLMVLGIE